MQTSLLALGYTHPDLSLHTSTENPYMFRNLNVEDTTKMEKMDGVNL